MLCIGRALRARSRGSVFCRRLSTQSASQKPEWLVFEGTVAHSVSRQQPLVLLPQALLGVQNGKIAFCGAPDSIDSAVRRKAVERAGRDGTHYRLTPNQLLCPGFIDTHNHASQYTFTGCGRLPLLQWLQRYTFPAESRLSDPKHATHVYDRAVRAILRNGTTTACYFATIDWRSSVILAETCARYGQRAFIGKVCMDRHSPPTYIESTAGSLADTQRFVDAIKQLNNPLITPIITPRFVPTCSSELMHGLGQIAEKNTCHNRKLPIQSHLNENRDEIEWVKALHPECGSYTEVYDRHGLLNERTVMAHAIYLSESERELLRTRRAGISHCPDSNFAIKSGIADARRLLHDGHKVGLGTDIGGGTSVSMLKAMREAVTASVVLKLMMAPGSPGAGGAPAPAPSKVDDAPKEVEDVHKPIDYREAFYLATLGSAEVLNLESSIGNFGVGKDFDALFVDLNAADSPIDVFDADSTDDRLQKFLFQGDDRNISRVYVSGRLVWSR